MRDVFEAVRCGNTDTLSSIIQGLDLTSSGALYIGPTQIYKSQTVHKQTQDIEPICWLNPFRPEFTIVIFIHYKPRIDVAILDL